MSNISDLLREAAQEVALEEKEDTEEGIQKAAQQSNAQILREASPRTAGIPIEDPIILPKNVDVNEDVNALLEQMSIKPKYSGNTIDDIDALIQMQQKKTATVSNSKSRTSMDNYRRRKSEREILRSTKSLATSRTFDGQSLNSTEMSRVSQLLAKADDKSWGKNIKSTFSTPQQELLFRSMKVVRPTKINKQKQLLATAAGRLQKFETCDLDLHTTKRNQIDTEQRNKQHQSMRMSADRLCTTASKQPSRKALKADPTLRYATFDDAKECTFQPCIAGEKKKKKKNNNDEDEDERRAEDSKFGFINRMEAEERSRRDELEFAMGKAKYDALVDKKTCPRCGAKQSYDEFKEKRKSCVHCNVEYCAQVSWGKVGRRFFQSNLEYAQRVAEKKQRLRESLDLEFKCVQRTEVDPDTGKTITYLTERKQILTPTEELEFFDRMNEMMKRRELEVKELEDKVYTKKCPFKPTISARNHDKKTDSEEDEEENLGDNPVRAFLKRYKADLEDRRDKYPTKYAPSKSTTTGRGLEEKESLQPFRMSKSVDRGHDMFLS